MGLLKYSLELFKSLESETGQPVDFHETGSLRLATNQDRLDEFEHRKGIAATLGVPFEIISRGSLPGSCFRSRDFDDVARASLTS